MFIESYERKLNGNNLILEETGYIKENNEFEERMITENEIKSFLSCQMREEDNRKKYVYNITSRQSISQLFEEREFSGNDIIKLIRGLINIRNSLEEYLLDENHVILNPQFIFMDPETKTPFFVFYPYYEMKMKDSLQTLALYILEKTDHDDECAVKCAYGFYKMIINDDYFFEKLLEEKEKPTSEIVMREKNDIEKIKTGKEVVFDEYDDDMDEKEERSVFIICSLILVLLIGFLCLVKTMNIPVFSGMNERKILGICSLIGAISVSFPAGVLIGKIRKEKKRKRYKDIESKVIREQKEESIRNHEKKKAYGKTDNFDIDNNVVHRLVSYDSGKIAEFRIIKTPFTIGKSPDDVDGCIKNKNISRIHAKITKENGIYFLTDTNSTNGTYLNGRLLDANESARITENDEISFADSVFYFR